MKSSIKPLALRIFTKKHGFALQSEALALLEEHVGQRKDAAAAMAEIATAYAQAKAPPLVTAEALSAVILQLFESKTGEKLVESNSENADIAAFLYPIAAFSVPRMKWTSHRGLVVY